MLALMSRKNLPVPPQGGDVGLTLGICAPQHISQIITSLNKASHNRHTKSVTVSI